MSDVSPIRTLSRADARWMLTSKVGDLLPAACGRRTADVHIIVDRSITYDIDGDLWIVVRCSCGQTVSGAAAEVDG